MARFTTKRLRTVSEVDKGHKQREITLPIDTPLLVKMRSTVGNVPAGLTVEAERHVAWNLIRRRLAAPVVSLDALPDLVVTAEDVDAAFGGVA